MNSPQQFSHFARGKLLALAVVLAGLWYLAAPATMTAQEQQLWEKVGAAQHHISQWRNQSGSAATEASDPRGCGLIGVEWSAITTTLGDLSSKRTACNPAWAIQFSRWFRELGLKPGDPIAIYSSASFPGLLLNALAAAETMDLKPLLIVSLGASTWGANHPDIPWPVLATELRRGGFIHHRADFYTLGAGNETGQGLAPEGVALLRSAANDADVELLSAGNLEDMVALKTELLQRHQPRLLVSIGGSHANLGDAHEVLQLHTGLVPATETALAGNGVIGAAMRDGTPVIHMLNIKSISGKTGIPYDAQPRKMAPGRGSAWWSGFGVILFFIVLLRHKRWRLEPAEG